MSRRLVGTGRATCPECAGGLPGEVHADLVCTCGSGRMQGATNWETVEQGLMLRSGSRCEIQSPECLAGPRGTLTTIRDRYRRSIHHRRPRGMGGTRRADVDSYAALVNTCGHGTIGCHWYAESNRTWALARGLLVPNNGAGDAVDPAAVPLTLPSGRRVLLDPDNPFYLPVTDGAPYAL